MRLKKIQRYGGGGTARRFQPAFVVKIAHEYRNYGLKLADLIQEGNIGLMHAVKNSIPTGATGSSPTPSGGSGLYIQTSSSRTGASSRSAPRRRSKLFFKMGQAKSSSRCPVGKASRVLGNRSIPGGEGDRACRNGSAHEPSRRVPRRLCQRRGDTTHIDFLTDDGEDQEMALIRKEMQLVQRNIAGALAI